MKVKMKACALVGSWASAMIAAAILTAPVAVAQQKVSVWSGVYTAAQDARGKEFHSTACTQCHGPRLNGAGLPDQPSSPAIADVDFLRKWSGKTVAELFEYVRKTMPADNPGTVSDQDSIDSIAHMFAVSEMPAGDKDLSADPNVLANIVIEPKAK